MAAALRARRFVAAGQYLIFCVMKRVLALLLTIVGLGWLATSLVHVITPREMTASAITESFVRIHLYAKTNQALPPTLEVLPRRDGYMNRTTDGWGHGLVYTISDNGFITLSSLGADQTPGGTGENADISRTYRSQNEDGTLIADQDMWIVDGELHEKSDTEQ
jgi:hypothetical protein